MVMKMKIIKDAWYYVSSLDDQFDVLIFQGKIDKTTKDLFMKQIQEYGDYMKDQGWSEGKEYEKDFQNKSSLQD